MKQKIKKIVTEACLLPLGWEFKNLDSYASLKEDYGLDSLDTVVIALAVEVEFEVSFADEEIENINTINDICTLVENKQQLM